MAVAVVLRGLLLRWIGLAGSVPVVGSPPVTAEIVPSSVALFICAKDQKHLVKDERGGRGADGWMCGKEKKRGPATEAPAKV